tara:strand:- start:3369 stop:3842 length:474 start_codon:yes stop_codon:yes gene_type:complete
MNFFKNLFFIIFLLSATISFAADTDKEKLKEQVNEIVKEIQNEVVNEIQEDDEVPLNDPFAGNEGNTNKARTGQDDGEEQDEMSLYNFKLVGLISGKDHSYISLANSSGEVLTLTLGQHLGKIKLADLRLTEAIFEKDDKTYIIIDFNGGIRETDEY